MATVTIDGKEYDVESLSEGAKSQLVNLQACDAKLQQLQQETAITQTARNTYAQALKQVLSEV